MTSLKWHTNKDAQRIIDECEQKGRFLIKSSTDNREVR
jgi:hypothetical protein